MKRTHKISAIALEILKLLKSRRDGLDIHQIRELLEERNLLDPTEPQQHLDRRLRELDPRYEIARERDGKRFVYRYVRPRPKGEWDYAEISKTLQAKIRSKAHGHCQMCGRTIEEDRIKLHADHKIPREWGGATEEDNLWAICSGCNEGKRNYFASFDTGVMKKVMAHKSVHRRIAELLHINQGEWVDCDLIAFVANAGDCQTDWPKRLRELRYFRLDIDTKRKKHGRRSLSYYRLNNWLRLPSDPTKAAREYERRRAKKNKK